MGYNTWYDMGCDVNAASVMAVADAMVALGLPALGYSYVNLDDCWAASQRASNGSIVPDPAAFPDGIQPLAAYIHSKGLKFGLFTDRGNTTCSGRTGSGGHEELDAATFAAWGVDFVKEASCNASEALDDAVLEFSNMRNALLQSGRPVYLSLCCGCVPLLPQPMSYHQRCCIQARSPGTAPWAGAWQTGGA